MIRLRKEKTESSRFLLWAMEQGSDVNLHAMTRVILFHMSLALHVHVLFLILCSSSSVLALESVCVCVLCCTLSQVPASLP